MTVYIEYAIADNLLIDYLLLKESALFLKIKAKRYTVFLSALTGTAFAVLFPVLGMPKLTGFILKIACAALMCFIAAKHRSFADYFRYFNVFLLSTFILGGAVIGVLYLFGINYSENAYYQAKVFPVGISVFFSYLVFLGVKATAKRIAESAITVCSLFDCEISVRSRSFKLKAFYDSGNFLIDGKSGLPIVLVEKRAFEKMTKAVEPKKHGEIIVNSAGSRFSLPTYKIDFVKIKIKDETHAKDAVMAVSGNLSGISGADVLIGKPLVGGIIW